MCVCGCISACVNIFICVYACMYVYACLSTHHNDTIHLEIEREQQAVQAAHGQVLAHNGKERALAHTQKIHHVLVQAHFPMRGENVLGA